MQEQQNISEEMFSLIGPVLYSFDMCFPILLSCTLQLFHSVERKWCGINTDKVKKNNYESSLLISRERERDHDIYRNGVPHLEIPD